MAGERIAHGTVEIEVNDRDALARLSAIQSEFSATMRDIDRMEADVTIGGDLHQLEDDVANAKRMVRELKGEKATVTLDAEKKRLTKEIAEAEALVKELDGKKATVEIEARGAENVLKAERAMEDAHRKRIAAEEKMDRQHDALADKIHKDNLRRVNQEAKVRESLNRQRMRELSADEKMAYEMQRRRTVGVANEVREVLRLQSQYAKLTDRIERIDKKRPIGREARAKVHLEATAAYAEMEVVKAKLNALGGHPPVEIKADLDRTILRRAGDFLSRLGNKASKLSDLTIRLGPFTTSLKGLAVGLSFLGPIITDLLGGASALVGVLGGGISGAAAIGAGAVTGLGLGFLGLMFSMRNTKQEITNARTAINAYQKAVQKYGAGSKQAKTAQDAMNNTLKSISPLAAETAKGIERFYNNWDKHTNATRKNFGKIAHDGFDALNAITPMWASRTNQLSGMLAKGMQGAFKFIKGDTGRGLLDGIMGNFNAQVPTILHGLGSIGHAFLNIASEGAKNLNVLAGGFDNLGGKLLAWTQSDNFGATIKRWVGYARDLMRFFGAAGRVIMHFFGAGADAGDRFVKDMTRGLNKWDRFLTSVNGRKSVAGAMQEAVSGTEALWAAIAPLAGAFVEWATNLAPFITGVTQGVAAVSHLVEFVTRLIGMTGAVGTLGATLGAVWALGKIGSFLSLVTRAYEIMKSMAALGAAGGLKSFFGLDGKGGFLGQLRQKSSIAEGGAAAAAEMRAGIIEGGAAAAGELRSAMATGGLAAGGESAIARRLAVPAGTGAVIAGEEAVAGGAAAIGISAAGAAAGLAVLGGALLVGIAYFTRHKDAADKVNKALKDNAQTVAIDARAQAQQADAQNRSVSSYREAHKSIKTLRGELKELTKGTVEYRNKQLELFDARQKDKVSAANAVDAARKGGQAANQTISDTKRQIALLHDKIALDRKQYQQELDAGAGPKNRFSQAEAADTKALANAQRALNSSLNSRAAATLNVARAQRKLSALTGEAAQQAGSLARTRPGLAQNIAVKFKLPTDVGNVAAAAKKALGQGVTIKTVLKIVADSKDAESALKRLRTVATEKKMIRVGITGDDGVLSKLSKIDRKAVRKKIAHIIENGGDATISKINQIIAKQIRDKKFSVQAAVSQAIAAVDMVAAHLGSLHDRTIYVTTVVRQFNKGGGGGITGVETRRGTASGTHAGHAPYNSLVGEGGAHEWGVNNKTGEVTRYGGPMVAKLGMHDAVIPVEPKHRAAGRDIFKQIAKDLGLNMFAASKKAKKRKPTTTDRPVHGKGNKLNLTDFGKHRAAVHADKRIKSKTKPVDNYSKIPEVQRVRKLQQEQSDQDQLIGIYQGRMTEPDTLIKKVGEDVQGNDIYGIDQDALNAWAAQVMHLRDMYAEMMQIIHDLSVAISAALPVVRAAIKTAIGNISTLHTLEHGENAIINSKGASTSERQAARARLGEYQDEEKRQQKIKEDGQADVAQLIPARHQTQFDYATAENSYNEQDSLLNALQGKAEAEAAAAQAPLPDPVDPADLAIAKAESEGDVAGQIAGYNAKIAEAQSLLADNNPYNDIGAYNDITSSKAAIAGLQDTGSTGGGAGGGSTDAGNTFAAQTMALSAARSELYKSFGSNFGIAASMGTTMSSPLGTGAYGINPATSVTGGTTNNIVNNYAAPPPDPHTWSQGLAWELQAAI